MMDRRCRTTPRCFYLLILLSQIERYQCFNIPVRSIHQHHTTTLTSLHLASTTEAPTEWRGQVLQQLKQIIDPDLGADIVTLGFIQQLSLTDDGIVSFDVALTTPACPVKDQFQADCIRLVETLDWVKRANVTMTAQEIGERDSLDPSDMGLSHVGSIIAVASCKGGVGKSTTAVNLAFTLQSLGATVGILDTDVYGPSLPTMVTPDDEIVRFVGRQIAPLQRNGVRLMSTGFVNDEPAVMRGPMVTQVLEQVLRVTHWGPLDYLIVDMPPGTGDIALTLTQRLNVTAAVIVSTPQELSFVDVVRGVEMFDTVQVPCVAVVENMGYYEPPVASAVDWDSKIRRVLKEQIGKVDGTLANALAQTVRDEVASSAADPVPIFGAGHKHRLANQYGIEHTFSVPLLTNISAAGDGGTPYVLKSPQSAAANVYRDLAQTVVSEVAKIKYANKDKAVLEYDGERNVFVLGDAQINPVALRGECRCAVCVEEMTGRQLLDKSSISDSIRPRKVYNTGNYAVSVDWNDGHRSLYPYRQVEALIATTQKQTTEELVGAL